MLILEAFCNKQMEEQTNIKVVKTYSLFATTFWPGWFLHWLLGDFSSPWRANTRQCKKISLTSDQRVMESWYWHLKWEWEVYIHIPTIETTTRTCYMYRKMCIEGPRNCQFMRMVTKNLLWLQLPFHCEMMTWMQRLSRSIGYHAIPEISTCNISCRRRKTFLDSE